MIRIVDLKCGVRVVMDKIEHVQSAAIGFWVRAGAVDEKEEYSGISHFIEHMMFKGTKNRTAMQIAEDIDKMGGQINAFTSNETTCYYVKTLSSNLYKSTDVLLDMLTESLFDREEMDRERKVICEEIKMSQDAPDDLAQETIMELVNKGNPMGKSILGTPETLANITRDVMVDYIEKEYTRDNLVVAISGNFDEDKICEYLEGKLLKFNKSKEKKNFEIKPYEPSCKVIVKDIEQANFFIGTQGVVMTNPDNYKMMVLSKILGGSMSSRLFQSVREKQGLAYSVYSANSTSTIAGGFYIYAGVSQENIKPALEAIKEQLYLLRDEGITVEELAKAKEQIKSSYLFALENVASRMFTIGKSLILTGEIRTQEEIIEMIDKITLEEVNEISSLITDPKKYCGALVCCEEIDFEEILRD